MYLIDSRIPTTFGDISYLDITIWFEFQIPILYVSYMSRVSCQKGPTRHAYAWQIGPFWQDTLDVRFVFWLLRNKQLFMVKGDSKQNKSFCCR